MIFQNSIISFAIKLALLGSKVSSCDISGSENLIFRKFPISICRISKILLDVTFHIFQHHAIPVENKNDESQKTFSSRYRSVTGDRYQWSISDRWNGKSGNNHRIPTNHVPD